MRPPTDREWKTALRLLERLANPSGSWRDDENQRLAKQFLKKQQKKKNHE
jgi:hypothetical protein